MKRLIFSLLFVSTIFISSAQDKSEHLSFKGVPIDGTLNEYVSKMKAAGFSYLGTQDGTAILQGDFAGFKSCTVGVSTLKAVNVVSTIGVIFPSHDDWSSLERDYDHLKSMLTQKYGEPNEVVEQFQGRPTQIRTMKNCMNYIWIDVLGTLHLKLKMAIYNCLYKRANTANASFY